MADLDDVGVDLDVVFGGGGAGDRFLVEMARLGLAELFGSTDEQDGMLYQTMLMGLAAQWLLDPETAPSGGDLLNAMRTLVAGLV